DDSLGLEEGDTRSDVSFIGRASERREPPLDPAIGEEVGEFSVHFRPFGRPKAAAPKLVAILRLTGLLRKPPPRGGFYLEGYGTPSIKALMRAGRSTSGCKY